MFTAFFNILTLNWSAALRFIYCLRPLFKVSTFLRDLGVKETLTFLSEGNFVLVIIVLHSKYKWMLQRDSVTLMHTWCNGKKISPSDAKFSRLLLTSFLNNDHHRFEGEGMLIWFGKHTHNNKQYMKTARTQGRHNKRTNEHTNERTNARTP